MTGRRLLLFVACVWTVIAAMEAVELHHWALLFCAIVTLVGVLGDSLLHRAGGKR
ncbi:MAG: hypothetical protein ACXVGF_04535 [Blastococcus sp.]